MTGIGIEDREAAEAEAEDAVVAAGAVRTTDAEAAATEAEDGTKGPVAVAAQPLVSGWHFAHRKKRPARKSGPYLCGQKSWPQEDVVGAGCGCKQLPSLKQNYFVGGTWKVTPRSEFALLVAATSRSASGTFFESVSV